MLLLPAYARGMTISNSITTCAERTLGLAEALLKDIPADRFARFADGANGPIEANHPAFVYGHLSLYWSDMIGMLGKDGSDVAVPEGWREVLAAGVTCVDDPDGTVFAGMDTIVDHFTRGAKRAIEVVGSLSDDELTIVTPNENFRAAFPTMDVVSNFLMNNHVMFHLGQVSTWRRAEGLGSAM